MKKICMIIPSFTAKGGIASVVNGYKDSALEKEYNINYIETFCDGGTIKKFIKSLIAYLKFIKEIMIRKPHLIHVHSSFGASFYRKLPFIYLSSWLNIPVVNHIHGSAIDELYTNASKRKKNLVINNFKRCNRIIVLSEEWKQRYKDIIDIDKIIVIENHGVIHENDSTKERNHKKMVLFLGFLNKNKGCFDIPSVIKKVTESFSNVKFILAGDGSKKDIKIIRELLKEKEIENYVIMPGWVCGEEKNNLLRVSDVFILPSYSEAMPMSILEAMGYGLPIVSTNIGGIPQLVHSNVNGFIYEPGDINGFTTALLKLLSDDELLLEMGNNSISIVEYKYSLEKHINKIKFLYEEF